MDLTLELIIQLFKWIQRNFNDRKQMHGSSLASSQGLCEYVDEDMTDHIMGIRLVERSVKERG